MFECTHAFWHPKPYQNIFDILILAILGLQINLDANDIRLRNLFIIWYKLNAHLRCSSSSSASESRSWEISGRRRTVQYCDCIFLLFRSVSRSVLYSLFWDLQYDSSSLFQSGYQKMCKLVKAAPNLKMRYSCRDSTNIYLRTEFKASACNQKYFWRPHDPKKPGHWTLLLLQKESLPTGVLNGWNARRKLVAPIYLL